jgi:hypothetical protein
VIVPQRVDNPLGHWSSPCLVDAVAWRLFATLYPRPQKASAPDSAPHASHRPWLIARPGQNKPQGVPTG